MRELIALGKPEDAPEARTEAPKTRLSPKEREKTIEKLRAEMRDAAKRLEFERAAYLRDRIRQLEEEKK